MSVTLIETLRAAERGSRKLDGAVCKTAGDCTDYHASPNQYWMYRGTPTTIDIPHVTTTVDAALALAERVMPGQWMVIIQRALDHIIFIINGQGGLEPLPRAICIALLEAKEVEDE